MRAHGRTELVVEKCLDNIGSKLLELYGAERRRNVELYDVGICAERLRTDSPFRDITQPSIQKCCERLNPRRNVATALLVSEGLR